MQKFKLYSVCANVKNLYITESLSSTQFVLLCAVHTKQNQNSIQAKYLSVENMMKSTAKLSFCCSAKRTMIFSVYKAFYIHQVFSPTTYTTTLVHLTRRVKV